MRFFDRKVFRNHGDEVTVVSIEFDDGIVIRNSRRSPNVWWSNLEDRGIPKSVIIALKKKPIAYVVGHYGKKGEFLTPDNYDENGDLG